MVLPLSWLWNHSKLGDSSSCFVNARFPYLFSVSFKYVLKWCFVVVHTCMCVVYIVPFCFLTFQLVHISVRHWKDFKLHYSSLIFTNIQATHNLIYIHISSFLPSALPLIAPYRSFLADRHWCYVIKVTWMMIPMTIMTMVVVVVVGSVIRMLYLACLDLKYLTTRKSSSYYWNIFGFFLLFFLLG